MRVRVQADKLDRRTFKLSKFKGADYSSAPTEIVPQRAASMENLLLEDGTLCKRKGWEQVYKLEGRINGMWAFTDPGRWYTQSVLIVHAGAAIYEIQTATGKIRLLSAAISTITDARSYAVEKNKKLYILCGDYIVYGNFSDSGSHMEDGEPPISAPNYELRRVAYDVDTYIPTTCHRGSMTSKLESRTLEDVNFLSKRRRNIFTIKPEELFYEVDTRYIDPTGVVKVTFTDSFGNQTVKTNYPLSKTQRQFGYLKLSNREADTYVEMTVEVPYNVEKAENTTNAYEGYVVSQITSQTNLTNRRFTLNSVSAHEGYRAMFLGEKKFLNALRDFVTCYPSATFDVLNPDGTKVGSYVAVEYSGICNIYDKKDFDSDSFLFNDYLGQDISPTPTVGTWSKNSANELVSFSFHADYAPIKDTNTTYSVNNLKYLQDRKVYYQEADYSDRISRCSVGCLFGVDGANNRMFVAGNPDTPNICYNSDIDDFTYFPDQQTAACGEENSRITGFSRLGDGTLAVFKDTRGSADVGVYYRTGERIPETDDAGNTIYKEIFPLKAGAIGVGCVAPYATANLAGDPLMLSSGGVYGIVLSSNVATDERYARERSRTIGSALNAYDLSDVAAIVHDNRYYLSVGDTCFVADARYKYTIEGDMDDTYNYEWFRLTNIPARTWAVLGGQLYFGTGDGRICRFHDRYCDVTRDYIYRDAGQLTVSGGRLTFNAELYPLISRASYYLDGAGIRHEITDLNENGFACALSDGLVDLTFVTEIPVRAEWRSGLFDLGSSGFNKNLYALSVSQVPVAKGQLQCGYNVKRGGQTKEITGGRTFDGFGAVDFGDFCFEADAFQTVSYCRVFERGLLYLQLFFVSDGECDCRVTELTAEYGVTNKYIGAW